MDEKYTAIYIDSFMRGSHNHSITKMARVIKKETESLLDCLKRYYIENDTVYLFVGWPLLQGENKQDLKETEIV